MSKLRPTLSAAARLAVFVVTLVLLAQAGSALNLGNGEWVETPFAAALCSTHDPNGRCKEWCAIDPATGVETPTGIVCALGENAACDPQDIIHKGY